MATPTINPAPAAGNNPSGIFTPVPHTHPFTAITGLRFGTNGRVEPVYDAINVTANDVLIALYDAASTPGSASAVTVSFPTLSIAVQNNDGDDTSQAKAQADEFLAQGRITSEEYAKITAPTPPPAGPGVAPSSVQPPGKAVDPVAGSVSFATQLTPLTTLGDMIKKVTFPRTVTQLSECHPSVNANGVVNNLAALAKNIYEPVKAKYSNALITNSFRHGASIGGGQHGTGQAMDLQFRGVAAYDYFDIAVWMSKNLPYAQLLLEYLPNKTVWIHVSYEIPGLPYGGITVKPQNKLATLNGAAGGRFVPNLHKDILVSSVPNRIVAA
jgi:hypothetical protein